MKGKIRVLMLGPDRKVHGGISAVVNNYYEAGLTEKIKLKYLGTMIDGGKGKKLVKAVQACVLFLFSIPFFDILHVNMASDASYYRKKVFIDIADFFRKKIIIHEHGGDFVTFYQSRLSNKGRQKVKKTLNKAHTFIVLSKQWYDFFSVIVEQNKMEILENGIFVPADFNKDYCNHNILFLGRLCKEKGIRELIEAVDKLVNKIPDVHLYLGGIWEDKQLERLTEGKEQYITSLGWIDQEEKKQKIADCSIFVLPSYFEGQPVSLLEAMAGGMCVVASGVGGIPQIIMTDCQGILIPPEDEAALEAALESVLSSEKIRKEFGENAYKRIKGNYDIEDCVIKLQGIYERVKG